MSNPDDPQAVYTDRRSHYANVALSKANSASHPDWDPDQGFAVNPPPDTVVNLADPHDHFNTYPSYDQAGTHTFVPGTPHTSYKSAWQKIVSGDPDSIASGNQDLLQKGEFSIVQPQYDYLSTFWFSGLPTPFTNQIHPYHRSFIEEEPTGDILQVASRWGWITHPQGMWENWVACGADERDRLLQLPFDHICNGNFGISGRPDLLPPGGP